MIHTTWSCFIPDGENDLEKEKGYFTHFLQGPKPLAKACSNVDS